MDRTFQNWNFPIMSLVSYVSSLVDCFLCLPNSCRNPSLLFLCALGLGSGFSFLHQIQNWIIKACTQYCSHHEHFSVSFCFWLWYFSNFPVSSIWTVSFLVNMALVFKRLWSKNISILGSKRWIVEELKRGYEAVSTLA